MRLHLGISLLFAALLALTFPVAGAGRVVTATSSTTAIAAAHLDDIDRLKGLKEEQSKRLQAEFGQAIADAKLEVIAAANSRLEVWIGIFGVLITVLLAVFGILTWNKAASAAKLEMANYRDQADKIMKGLQDQHDQAGILTEEMEKMISRQPGTGNETPLAEDERPTLAAATVAAEQNAPGDRSFIDFMLLIRKAGAEKRWEDYLALADGMAYLHRENAAAAADAEFAKGFANFKLGQYEQAGHYFAKYLEMSPEEDTENRSMALSNWGNALNNQAEAKEGSEADNLWSQAFDKYNRALAIKPDRLEALCNWGIALATQARRAKGAEADTLLSQAIDKFERALVIKPDMYHALCNLALALLDQARAIESNERSQLLYRSEELLNRANASQPGSGSYNLACLFAFRGDAVTAAEWLVAGKFDFADFPDCAHIAKDTDFDQIRDDPAFQHALTEIGCG